MSLALAVGACGDSTGPDDADRVAGNVYELQSVAGNPLPARFEPADEAGVVDDAQISAGRLIFRTNGTMEGEELYTSPSGLTSAFDYGADYTQSGERVLIFSYGNDFPPDTGIVNGNTLTVQAQFFRGDTDDTRFTLSMVYRRE